MQDRVWDFEASEVTYFSILLAMTELSSPVRISLQENNDVLSDDIEKAGQILTRGGTIAIPTDTIYGVASLAQSTEGVQKLYEMKQRDPEKPLAICVGDVEDISRYEDVLVRMLGILS